MALLDLLRKAKPKSSCTRCKKEVAEGGFERIGNRVFCVDCIHPKNQRFPEYLVFRTPSMEDNSIYAAKVFVCAQCHRENENPSLYQWIANQRLCIYCAIQLMHPANKENGDKAVDTNHPLFYYPVFDIKAEETFWADAIQEANDRRRRDGLTMPEVLKTVDRIFISEENNPLYPEDPDSISLSVYSNEQRTIWCFRLDHDYVSGWDGLPESMGGFITPEQFLEYADRIGFHHYDGLLMKKD